MVAQPLFQQALDPISYDRVSHFLGDGEAKAPSERKLGTSPSDREDVATVQLDPVRLNGEVLGASAQPLILGEPKGTARRRHPSYFFAAVTEIRLRPFARRRRRTSRPPRVFLRARNPWVRLRLLLCG